MKEYQGLFEQVLKEICQESKSTYEVRFYEPYPILINTEKEAEHVRRVAEKMLGKGLWYI